MKSLSLAYRDIFEDILIKETGEYLSQVAYSVPDYYTRIKVGSLDLLKHVFQSCTLLVHLDLEGCVWVKSEHVNLIINESPQSLRSVNLMFCPKFRHDHIKKLFIFPTHQELVDALKSMLNRH